tara:strand:+ start:2785 stop:3285 length:501 start_codon:yes stop_codon:yes gene_type:complete
MLAPSIILFYAAATLTLGGGLGVVMARNIVYAALALLISLMGVSGIFLLAFAEFLALVQILIYGGAVIIVILFALMLTRIEDFSQLSDHPQWPIGAGVAGLLFFVMVASIVATQVRTESERTSVEFKELGNILFTEWAIPFEVASLVLLVALIGAVILVRVNGERN